MRNRDCEVGKFDCTLYYKGKFPIYGDYIFIWI